MKTFSVKNFERFQHYKDRAPPWIKLYNELLENYEFGILPDAQKGQLISIWLLASRTDNRLPFDPAWIASKINATSSVDLNALLDAGFITNADSESAEHAEHVATPAQQRAKENGFGSRHISDEVKRAVWVRDSGRCQECGSNQNIEYDHKHPVSKGGSSDEGNIQLLCRVCNRRKRVRVATPAQPSAEPRERGEKRRVETEEIAASPPKTRKKQSRDLPDNFELNATNWSYAKAFRFSDSEIRREHQRFCMNAKAKGLVYADWNAAEHNWITKAAEFAGKRQIEPGSSSDDDGMIEVLDQIALEAWDAHGKATNGTGYPRNKKGGWRFPSKFPPGYESTIIADVQKLVAGAS